MFGSFGIVFLLDVDGIFWAHTIVREDPKKLYST